MNRLTLVVVFALLTGKLISQQLPKFHVSFAYDQRVFHFEDPYSQYLKQKGSSFQYNGLCFSLYKSVISSEHSSLQLGIGLFHRKFVVSDAQDFYKSYLWDLDTLIPFNDKGDLIRISDDLNFTANFLQSFHKESLKKFFLNVQFSTCLLSYQKTGIFTTDKLEFPLYNYNLLLGDWATTFDSGLSVDLNYWLSYKKKMTPLSCYLGSGINLYSTYSFFNQSIHVYGGLRFNFSSVKMEKLSLH